MHTQLIPSVSSSFEAVEQIQSAEVVQQSATSGPLLFCLTIYMYTPCLSFRLENSPLYILTVLENTIDTQRRRDTIIEYMIQHSSTLPDLMINEGGVASLY